MINLLGHPIEYIQLLYQENVQIWIRIDEKGFSRTKSKEKLKNDIDVTVKGKNKILNDKNLIFFFFSMQAKIICI